LQQQKLICLLEHYTSQKIDVYAIYPHRQHLTEKVKVLIGFLQESEI